MSARSDNCIKNSSQARRPKSAILAAPALRVMAGCGRVVLAAALTSLLVGCFNERSFPMRHRDIVLARPGGTERPAPRSAREWLTETHPTLHALIPRKDRPVLLTEQMTDASGRARDAYAWFDRQIEKMQGLTSNWWALQHTAQSIEKGYAIEEPARLWPGFEDVWIPVNSDVSLHGFLGLARGADGNPIAADCVVVIPGLWGDNGAKRSRDVSVALFSRGFHVLSLEPRAHGQTEARYPQISYTYGVLETQDLMKVSEWLQDREPAIRRTGLMGFCWGANQALLAAWFDGRAPDDASIMPNVRRVLEPVSTRRHFSAGVMAFSPVLRWEVFLDRMDIPRSVWTDPSPELFKESAREHMIRKGYPEVTGSLRRWIDYDFRYSAFGPHFPIQEGYRFLRLLPYRDLPEGDKLERARMPVLIVHGINDPLQTAQEVVDLIAQTSNPNVAAVILPGGGHIGFQAWSRAYFYSLILNFFDPHHGPAAGQP